MKPVHKSGAATAVGTLDGSMLTIKVARECSNDDIEFQTVETTTKRERTNQSPTADWTAGIAGVAMLGLGAMFLATPSTFVTSGSGNASGSGTGATGTSSPGTSKGDWIGLGVLLVGAGAALGVIPVVDGVRASGSTREISTAVVTGATVSHASCGTEPYAKASVSGSLGASKRPYGVTDADGVLQVNLWEQVSAETITGPNAALTLQLVIDGKRAGQVNIHSLPGSFEETAWQQLVEAVGDGGATGCAKDVVSVPEPGPGIEPGALWDLPSCAPLERFVRLYGAGTHGADATDLLKKLRAKREAARRASMAAAARVRAGAAQQAAGRAAAEKQAKEHGVCVARCKSECNGDSGCVTTCMKQHCS